MTSKFSDIDEYGFKRGDDFDYSSYETIMTTYYTVLTTRRIKWDRYMTRKPNFQVMNAKMKRFIRKGVPAHLRGHVWMHVSGAYVAQFAEPELYVNLLREPRRPEIVEIIEIDLPRTFPENIYFDTIKSQLFNVLVAYAHHNPDVGYCQGLNYIAGLILIVTKDEESTFWLLKMLAERIVPSYHTKTMSGLINDINVLKELIEARAPEIIKHIDSLGLPIAVITTKWFICLFAEVLPIETVLRVWDCLFAEGYKIIFRASLSLFLRHKEQIMACEDISQLASLFRDMVKSPIVTNCHEFMSSIFTTPGPLRRRNLDQLRRTTKKVMR